MAINGGEEDLARMRRHTLVQPEIIDATKINKKGFLQGATSYEHIIDIRTSEKELTMQLE